MSTLSSDFYATLYDGLYATGYHRDQSFTLTWPLIEELRLCHATSVASVLDVGCSHGRAVEELWHLGMTASGVDVSHLAVMRASRLRTRNARCTPPCFRQGSATQLPWPNASFDAIISSDVLEHLAPTDIPAVVSEWHRVARSLVLVLIAPRAERETWHLAALNRAASEPNGTSPDSAASPQVLKELHRLRQTLSVTSGLHLSVFRLQWWIAQFTSSGAFRALPSASVAGSLHIALQRLPSLPAVSQPLGSAAAARYRATAPLPFKPNSLRPLPMGRAGASSAVWQRRGATRNISLCAVEQELCDCDGVVWYGQRPDGLRRRAFRPYDAWRACAVTAEVHGSTPCSLTTFGRDPQLRQAGACFCTRADPQRMDGSGPVLVLDEQSKCADEGGTCECDGTLWFGSRFYNACGSEAKTLEQMLSVCVAAVPARYPKPTPCVIAEMGRNPVARFKGSCFCEHGVPPMEPAVPVGHDVHTEQLARTILLG